VCTFGAGESVTTFGTIEGVRANVRETPYALPDGFEWSDINVQDDREVCFSAECVHVRPTHFAYCAAAAE
jgi:hypothetical protein